MNIAHVVFSFNTGGIENLIVDIFNNWYSEDKLLLCIVNESKNNMLLSKIKQSSNVNYVCLERSVGGDKLQYVRRLEKVLQSFNTDCVHCHSNNVLKFCIPIKIKHPSWKFVLTIHDTNIYGGLKKIDKIVHKRMLFRMVAISSSVKHDVIMGGYPEKRIRLVYNGIDPKKFLPPYKKNSSVRNVICVARLCPEKKGQDILIKALAEVCKVRDDVKCLLVGEAPYEHPEYEIAIRTLIENLNLQDKVELLGNRNDVPQLLSSADVFILPSRYEGFGISVVEAMFARIPVIASDVDGPQEIINSGVNGYLFKSGDFEELSRLILELLDNDNTLITDTAYKYAIRNYSIYAMRSSLKKVYEGL